MIQYSDFSTYDQVSQDKRNAKLVRLGLPWPASYSAMLCIISLFIAYLDYVIAQVFGRNSPDPFSIVSGWGPGHETFFAV